MPDFVEVRLDDGTTVLFQAAESDLVRDHAGGAEVTPLDEAAGQLESIATATEKVSRSLRQRMTPDELKLEINIGLSGEVGWFFAKSKLDAGLKATLTWKAAKPE